MAIGNEATPPERGERRRAAWLALGLGVAAILAGLPGLSEIGVTWDEPRYFQSVERIQEWTARAAGGELSEMLRPEAIREAWDVDRFFNPHPPAYKIGMAVTEAMFGGLVGEVAGYRLSSLLAFGLLVGLLVAWTARLAGTTAGLATGLSLLLMPRMFGHAHIGATDLPLTLCWVVGSLGVLLYAREERVRWILVAGLAFGLGCATKFTAFLLPVPLIAWMLLAARSRAAVRGLIFTTALAMIVAVLVNPAAWPDPIGYQSRLVGESLSRESVVPISTFYAGRTFGYVVPWQHAIVMTVASLPVAILALAVIGLRSLKSPGPRRAVVALCLVQVAFWWGLLALPSSPNHDGVRLWLPMFPFVAILAGLGFDALARGVERRMGRARRLAGALLLGVLYFGPAAVGLVSTAPHHLAYYGEAVGGPAGAERRGMEATYWFDAVTAGFRDRMNEALPEGATIRTYPNAPYLAQLQELGLVRSDLRFTDTLPADYLLLLARKAMFTRNWNSVYRNARPELAVELDGVELVGLYRWNEGRGEGADAPDGGEVE
ncbi:MAG: ArnT family glycosyltransferase [Gemmatimonadota bacterium]